MTIESIKKILQKLSISYQEILPVQSGYRNKNFPIKLMTGEIVNLIVYKDEPGILERIKRVNSLSNFLHTQGLPVRHVQKNKSVSIITIKTKETTRYACIYNYLPGKTIEWEQYTRKHIKLLGWAMGGMHKKNRNYEFILRSSMENGLGIRNKSIKSDIFPLFMDEMREQIIDMQEYFLDDGVERAMREKLGIKLDHRMFDKFLKLQEKLTTLEYQILHLDFVRGNILFKKNDKSLMLNGQSQETQFTLDNLSLSGIIDFEKSAYGPIIADIARTLAFLITDCKKYSEQKIIKYFIDSGYVKRGQSEIPSFELLQPLMHYFWLYDFYKFLKHNPYESLRENYHYGRTVKKLGAFSLKIKPTLYKIK